MCERKSINPQGNIFVMFNTYITRKTKEFPKTEKNDIKKKEKHEEEMISSEKWKTNKAIQIKNNKT